MLEQYSSIVFACLPNLQYSKNYFTKLKSKKCTIGLAEGILNHFVINLFNESVKKKFKFEDRMDCLGIKYQKVPLKVHSKCGFQPTIKCLNSNQHLKSTV